MRTLKIALVLLTPAVALANGYDIPNTSPRDLAMSASVTADQRDAAAAYGNPAALSKIDGLSVNASIGYLDIGTKWTGSGAFAGASERTKYKPVPPVSTFVAYGFELADRKAGVGFGVNVPGGGNVAYADDWEGRGRIITVDRKVYGFYLTGGYEVLPRLRLGGGLVYYYATEYLKQGIQPFPGAYGELSAKGGAFSFDLAAEYAFESIPLTVGADFKYKATMKLSGDGKFVVPAGLLPPGGTAPPVDQGVRHHLTYPTVLNVGAAYRITEPWLVTGVFTWNGYNVYGSDVFYGDRGAEIRVNRDYRNGYVFRVGTEYTLGDFQIRGGLMRDISGLRTSTYSPTLPDSSSWCVSLGGAWAIQPNLSVQAGVFRAFFDKVTATGAETFPGSYETGVLIVSAGVVWNHDLGGK